jgi:hypothetical protein
MALRVQALSRIKVFRLALNSGNAMVTITNGYQQLRTYIKVRYAQCNLHQLYTKVEFALSKQRSRRIESRVLLISQ